MASPMAEVVQLVSGGALFAPQGPMMGDKGPLSASFEPGSHNDELQDKLDDAVRDIFGSQSVKLPTKLQCSFAVADLTADPTSPAYAGWNDCTQFGIWSLAKLLPLYGAFQLRADLRWLSAQHPGEGIAELERRAHRIYGQAMNAAADGRPWIKSMFEVKSPGVVAFQSGKDGRELSDEEIAPLAPFDDHAVTAERLRLSASADLGEIRMQEQLRLMAGRSDNASARTVVQALGFPFLWSLATRGGLYRRWSPLTRSDKSPSERSGLVLTTDYLRRWPAKEARRYGANMKGGPRGNARSLALLLTALAQERLVDRASHVEMLEMLRKDRQDFTRNLHERSPIGQGMHQPYPAASKWKAEQAPWAWGSGITPHDPAAPLAASKIGLLPVKSPERTFETNALLIRAPRPRADPDPHKRTLPVTAVLVAIDNHVFDPDLVQAFGRAMARRLDGLHGTVPP